MFLPVVSSRTPLRLFFFASLCTLDLRLFTTPFQTFCIVRKKSTGCGCVFRCERWCTFCTIVLRVSVARYNSFRCMCGCGFKSALIFIELFQSFWFCFDREKLWKLLKALETLRAYASFWKFSELFEFCKLKMEFKTIYEWPKYFVVVFAFTPFRVHSLNFLKLVDWQMNASETSPW